MIADQFALVCSKHKKMHERAGHAAGQGIGGRQMFPHTHGDDWRMRRSNLKIPSRRCHGISRLYKIGGGWWVDVGDCSFSLPGSTIAPNVHSSRFIGRPLALG